MLDLTDRPNLGLDHRDHTAADCHHQPRDQLSGSTQLVDSRRALFTAGPRMMDDVIHQLPHVSGISFPHVGLAEGVSSGLRLSNSPTVCVQRWSLLRRGVTDI